MDKILGFIVNHQYIWIIAVCIFALMLVGFVADLKRPKKLKKHVFFNCGKHMKLYCYEIQ